MIGVYKITNSITNEFYIGSSKNVQRRWREHTMIEAKKYKVIYREENI